MSVGYSQPCLHDQNIGFRIAMDRPRFAHFISEIYILHYSNNMVCTYTLQCFRKSIQRMHLVFN